jgi:hypothetical protein
MKLNKYITAAAIVLAVAVIVGFGQVARENMASPKPKETVIQVEEGGSYKIYAPEGGNIADITFASYGNPIVDRNNKPKPGSCHVDIRAGVSDMCSGRTSCEVWAHNVLWGDPCSDRFKKMVIGYTVYDPNAEAKAKEEEDAAAKAKADAKAKAKEEEDAAAKAKADAKATTATSTTTPGPADTSKTKSADTSATTPEPAAPDNTMMYVALGMGALVLVLGVFMLVSRPSPAPVVAGRRRR